MWEITVNGVRHGLYPDEKYARAAWKSLFVERPKASYTCELRSPQGVVVQTGTTPVGKIQKKGVAQ